MGPPDQLFVYRSGGKMVQHVPRMRVVLELNPGGANCDIYQNLAHGCECGGLSLKGPYRDLQWFVDMPFPTADCVN